MTPKGTATHKLRTISLQESGKAGGDRAGDREAISLLIQCHSGSRWGNVEEFGIRCRNYDIPSHLQAFSAFFEYFLR